MTISIEQGRGSEGYGDADDFESFMQAHLNMPLALGYTALEQSGTSAPATPVPESELRHSDLNGNNRGILYDW